MSMKQSRAEVVKSTVCAYLKRRQYTDSDVSLKSDHQLCQTKQQLAVLGAVDKEAANQNSISFNSFVLDFNVIDQHFSKLKSWISCLKGPVHRELYAFLPPLLCHLTIDILQWNVVMESNPHTVSSAVNFLKKHASSLIMEETLKDSDDALGHGCVQEKNNVHDHGSGVKYWRLLEELSNMENCWDICKSRPLLLFRSCKYRLNLTSGAVAVLQKYLADHAHLCLIQAIGTWFDVVEVPNSVLVNEDNGEEDDEDEIVVQLWDEDGAGVEMTNHTNISSDFKPSEEPCGAVSNGCEEETSPRAATIQGLPGPSAQGSVMSGTAATEATAGDEEKQMALLKAAIQGVEEGPCPQNPILLYSVQNADDNVVCTNVSYNADMLAAGFGSSEIKVWGLTEGGLPADIREVASSGFASCSKERRRATRLACDMLSSSSLEADVCGNAFDEEEEDWTALPIVLRGHSGAVQDVAFSGNTLFSCSADTTLRAWNLTDHSCMAIYRGHSYPVWCMDVCAWGLYMASGSHDRTARLWSPDRVYSLRTYAGHGLDVDCIRFHPNGIYLATGSCDNSVRLWSVTEGKLVRVFPHSSKGPAGSQTKSAVTPVVTSLAFSPDGKFLASGADDQKIRIWDLAAGSLLSELVLPATEGNVSSNETPSAEITSAISQVGGPVSQLSWSSGGDRLACAFRGGLVAVWESKQGRWAEFSAAPPTNSSATNVLLSDDSRPSRTALKVPQDGFTSYSTGMNPLTSLSYIEKRVLVAVGCASAKPME
ncbi:TAF5-like RNA polymerase II p300/CBP-associated factor-associated factor 65 kDa subunit 5L [Ischnura elegans]|uniref:TAF5-like RNA polymerase II p300/CBP-associated factor-associated factor 65 kDa subunit 5L n=1 Tax=Ischnura elegans TaxID=197161 RepID=UPI001ED8777D|nr:TAF5-like RNA polymerase II p300/CBP-associated factor-associated factor 65 kDa subunit 5L [Ischnura elegans]